MSASRAAVLLSAALAVGALAPLAAPAQAASCVDPVVESVTRNGAPIPTSWVQATCYDLDGSKGTSWSIWSDDWADGGSGASLDLGAAARSDTYVLKLNVGKVIPRVSDTKGAAVNVLREKDGAGNWHVTISAKPVLATGDCNTGVSPWTCPEVADRQWDGLLSGGLTDYGTWEDTAQREAFFGMDYFSNISAGAIPPDVVNDPDSGAQMIRLELANPHFLKSPSTTVFKGNVSVVIPNAFLKEVYEIDDPGSLTTGGLKPLVTGTGSGTVSVVETGSALRVDVTNLTFSQRNVKVLRGNIRPAKVTRLSADRVGAAKVKLTYVRAKARGSKVKGYTITCIAKSGPKHNVTVNDKRPSTTVTGLHTNTAYTCKVRARSAAGNGGWAKVGVAKKP